MKPKPESSFTLPNWITGELLDSWEHYFIQRERAKFVTSDRVKRNRLKELESFRRYENIDLVKIIDRSSDGTGKKPYLEFFLPSGAVIKNEKSVQVREIKVDSPEIKEIRNKINVEGRRIARLKSWHNPEERELMKNLTRKLKLAENDARKLGDLIDVAKNTDK